MDILYLLVPLSVVLVMLIIGMLAWAMNRGQFDDLEHQGEIIFEAPRPRADATAPQATAAAPTRAARPAHAADDVDRQAGEPAPAPALGAPPRDSSATR